MADTQTSAAPSEADERPRDLDGGRPADREPLVLEELLVEDVSIDGMCGVY
jgi:mycofactocin precursor